MVQIVIDSPEVRQQLIELKMYALENPFDFTKGIREDHTPAGDNPKHVFQNMNMRIVYSVERQPKVGICHHISISKNNIQPPSRPVVDFIMEQFGLGKLDDGIHRHIYMEGVAVNIIQPLGT